MINLIRNVIPHTKLVVPQKLHKIDFDKTSQQLRLFCASKNKIFL